MVDQEIRVLGDENIIANPKNSQKQYPLTFKAVPNVIVYGRKKADLNFTVPIPEGVNFNFNLDRTSIIFSDNFNLEEYSYIMVKNPFEEIQDFFYVSSLEELDPTGKEFNEFNDEVVKWLRRLVNIISNRCMIFETTLFKDLNNFPNIKSGQTFLRTEDGWTGITIRDINSELDLIFNKYVEEINKKIQEHQIQMNELLAQWKQDIQKYAENVKQYEIVRVVTQSGHGFVFEPVMYSISQRKFVKALFPHGADGIAVRVDDNNFRLVWAGRVEIPSTAKDTQQRDFVLGEYYFLGESSNGGIQREKPDTYYQHLFQVQYSDELQQYIADVLLSVPINQKGKRWDVGEAKTTVNDIEELKMSDFPVGKVVEVLGYYTAGDGAGHKRIIKAEDDGSGVQLSNNLWACIVHKNIAKNWGKNNLKKFIEYWNENSDNNYLDIKDMGMIELQDTLNIATYNLKSKKYDFTGTIIKYLGTGIGIKIGKAINHGMMPNEIKNLTVECKNADIGVQLIECAHSNIIGLEVIGITRIGVQIKGVILASIDGMRKHLITGAEKCIEFCISDINEITGLKHPLRYTNNGTVISNYLIGGEHSICAVHFGFGGLIEMNNFDFEAISDKTPLSLLIEETRETGIFLSGYNIEKSSGGALIKNVWLENFGLKAIELKKYSKVNFYNISCFGTGEKNIFVNKDCILSLKNSNIDVLFSEDYDNNIMLQNDIQQVNNLINDLTVVSSIAYSKSFSKDVTYLKEEDGRLDIKKIIRAMLGSSKIGTDTVFDLNLVHNHSGVYYKIILKVNLNGKYIDQSSLLTDYIFHVSVCTIDYDDIEINDNSIIENLPIEDQVYCSIICSVENIV